MTILTQYALSVLFFNYNLDGSLARSQRLHKIFYTCKAHLTSFEPFRNAQSSSLSIQCLKRVMILSLKHCCQLDIAQNKWYLIHK